MMIKRVVALDDDEEYLKLLKEFSELMALEFIGYSSSTELNFSNFQSTDLFLLDIYMPDDDGLDVLMKLKEFSFEGQLAIMSGAADNIIESMVSLADNLGVALLGNLKKPIKLKEFNALVKSHPLKIAPKNSRLSYKQGLLFSDIFTRNSIIPWFQKGYIYPVFQPQVQNVNLSVVGVECLTRVNHPDLGFLDPAMFIQMVENADLIDFYSLEFIDVSLKNISPLLNDNTIGCCSFNISATSLNIDFVNNLVNLINWYEVPASKITIEITETSAISMTTEAKYAISRLKVFGVVLSIDDFGTGYSVIRHLVELPFDELKIDRSFISELETNPTSLAIVNALMDLSKSLKFKLVIEGVESIKQIQLLSYEGEYSIQGYLYSKPLIIGDLHEFLAKGISGPAAPFS